MSSRGRGWYYKEKYGGGGGRGRGGKGPSTLSSSHSNSSFNTQSEATQKELSEFLHSIDGDQYGRYKQLTGSNYALEPIGFGIQPFLFIDHIQSDPYAPPSKIRVRVQQTFSQSLFSTQIRKVALEDHLTRSVHSHLITTNVNQDIHIDAPGQQVLQRTSIKITHEYTEARLFLRLPANGRRILGRSAATLLTTTLHNLVKATLCAAAHDLSHVTQFVDSIDDQEWLRSQLLPNNLLTFVRNGAMLPRASGADDGPMIQGIAFVSPKTLQRKFTLPHTGVIHGMAIPKGITLIVGGGFHGKSTLMDALQMGVYNHIPGDGREFVVTESTVLKIRAEDGRSITAVDVSPFISNLPFGQDTSQFSTLDASGSTSMAANIQEALEYGCSGFLFDEDSCATNFLIRDQRMQQLISTEKEPITPLISKVRSLHQDLGCSSVLVVGGCGSYLDVADLVISMDSYVAKDVTIEAKRIATALPEHHIQTKISLPQQPRLLQLPSNLQALADKMDNESAPTYHTSQPPMFAKSASTKSAARRTHMITFSGIDVDLSGLEQLVHTSQSRLIVDALVYLREIAETQNGATAALSLKEAVHRLEQIWDQDGLEAVGRFASTGGVVGDYARPRGIEVVAALNRIRGLASLG